MTDDRELRQQIAADAQLGATEASPGVRAFQFFLVPLIIVALGFLLYWGLSHMVANPRKAEDWLKDVKEGGLNTRPHAALKLVESLRRSDPPDRSLTPGIMELYKSTRADEDILRKTLLNCLGVLRDPRAAELLLDVALKETNLEERAAALDALGAIKDPSTLPALVKLLDDPNPVVRKYAAFNAGAVAGRTGDASVLEPLRGKLKDVAADVGWNAAFALAYFLKDGSGTDTLKKMLDRAYLAASIPASDPNAPLLAARAMVTACNAAAALKDRSFLPLLKNVIDPSKEPDPNAPLLAARAMVTACNAAAALKDRSFLPLLKNVIDPSKEPDADVRFIANQAIHQIEEK